MRIFRRIGVTGAAWLALAMIGGAALAGSVAESDPSLSLSPAEVESGKTLDSDEAFEMTVHLHAEPATGYELVVSYGGDAVGTCQADAATLTTDEAGDASWPCTFDTAENTGDANLEGSVVFAVDGIGERTALLSVRPAESGEGGENGEGGGEEPAPEESPEETGEEVEEGDKEKADNHGQCVSYWVHRAKDEGLHGKHKGQFVSRVAKSDCTGAGDDEEIAGWLQEAKDAQAAAGERRGKPKASDDGEGEKGSSGKAKGKSDGKGKGKGKGKSGA